MNLLFTADLVGEEIDADFDNEESAFLTCLMSDLDQKIPKRFEAITKPGQLCFVDTWPYPDTQVGGDLYETVVVCVYSRRVAIVTHKFKTGVGEAVQRVINHWGVHKFDYKYRFVLDGDPTMKHAERVCYRFGIDVSYLPPDYQSTSQAETTIHRITDAAKATLIASALDAKYLIYALKLVVIQDNFRWLSPDRPPAITLWPDGPSLPLDLTRLVPFGSICSVRKTRDQKSRSVDKIGKTLRLSIADGSLIQFKNGDRSNRGDSMIYVGLPNELNHKDKWFITINGMNFWH